MLNKDRLNKDINLVLCSRLMFDLPHFNNTGNIRYTIKDCVLYQLYTCKTRAVFVFVFTERSEK